MKEELKIKTLNTLTCFIEGEQDKLKVNCIVHSEDEHNNQEIKDVYVVSGNISIIPSKESGQCRVYVKTAPFVGLDATMEIDDREGSVPPGKRIRILTGED